MNRNPQTSVAAAKHRMGFLFREVGCVFLENEQQQFLFVRTHRLPDSWQPIGGGKEPEDDTLKSTAARELQEETNLILPLREFEFVCETRYDFGKGKVQFFRALLPPGTNLHLREPEIVEHRWLTLTEAEILPMFVATKTGIAELMAQMKSTA